MERTTMATSGGVNCASWPRTIAHAVHPQHELTLLRYYRNSCDLCHGALAGALGYRCDACDFDVHCVCLPDTAETSARGAQVRPPPPSVHPPPRPPWRPSSAAGTQCHHHGAHASAHPAPPPRRPQLHLSLSGDVGMSHQLGAQSSVYPAQRSNGYGTAAESSGDPQRYDHLQQQGYPTTNQNGAYTEAKDFGDAADYYDPPDPDDYDDLADDMDDYGF